MPRRETSEDPKSSRLAEYQRALAAFSRLACEVLPLDRLFQHACAHVSLVTHIKHSKILQYRADRGDLLLVAGVGWKPGVIGMTMSADVESPAGRSVQTAAPVIISDLVGDSDYRVPGLLREHGIVSLANVPVMIDGQNWGVLEVDAEEERSFSEEDVSFLTTYSNMIGLALARHYGDQRRLREIQEFEQKRAVWEALAREQQHRTKNNFQTILSFLSLQRRSVGEAGRAALSAAMDRVNAIALAHDQLSMELGRVGQVEFEKYLRSLCANIDRKLVGVVLLVEANSRRLQIPLDRAVLVGLIVNELVTNAFKYAFDDGSTGSIVIRLDVDAGAGEASISVSDDGKGMGPPRSDGLGLRIVEALSRQLAGRLEVVPVQRGTCTRIVFPTIL